MSLLLLALALAAPDCNLPFNAGFDAYRRKDLNQSLISFRAALQCDPKMVSAHGWLGAVDAATGDSAGAQTQRAALAQMQTECAGKCPKAADIQQELEHIDQNVAANKKPS